MPHIFARTFSSTATRLLFSSSRLFCVTLATYLALSSIVLRADWNGAPSPHDGQHLLIVRPGDFRGEDAPKSKPASDKAAAFGETVTLNQPLTANVAVRHAGKYDVWIRVASGEKQTIVFSHELSDIRVPASPKKLAFGTINSATNDVKGDATIGGPAGQAAFAKVAQQSGTIGKMDAIGGDKKTAATGVKKSVGIEDDLLADIAKTKGEKPATNWNHFTRIEAVDATRPAFWWRLATVELQPGDHALKLIPGQLNAKAKPLQIEAAFLTTATNFGYPFRGDIAAPPASYIRFRIAEAPPATGLQIGATIKMHYDPFSTGRVSLNPTTLSTTKSEPHTSAGFTRWYRLQDIERAPAFGRGEAHLILDVTAGKPGAAKTNSSTKPKGATQFAVYPHDDFVLREIDWNEPDGLLISFDTDFQTNLHKLRTFRDHAREHYEMALAATGGRVFPLTRGDLYFGNSWGNATSEAADYMVKTLRLLGFNCVGEHWDPAANRERYGWSSHAGHYWPPSFLPFDEADARRKYDEHYRDYFGKLTDKQREFYRGVSIFQIADEPGEIARSEMSSPLWRFATDSTGDKYEDVTGGSQLATKRADFSDIVLEGKIEDHSRWLGFRVWFDKPDEPAKFAEWRIGQVSVNRELNVASTRRGIESATEAAFQRPGAVLGPKPSPFKIVFSNSAAELYLNGKRISQHNKLPARGGFAIFGGAKAVRDLHLRPLQKDERIVSDSPDGGTVATTKTKPNVDLDVDSLLSDSPAKSTVRKPLRQAIADDWLVTGGMPDAHRGFRDWAKKQPGLTPELFGQKSWDDVRMLTVPTLVSSPADARLFYWSRRYSGYLTPHMFGLSADAIQRHAPNSQMKGFVALSGHSLNFPSETPLDMFQLAADTPTMIPGISDWMSYGSWRWDSHQSVAYSVAMYNAGARRYGDTTAKSGRPTPTSFPMMHCVGPSELRAYTMLANNCRYISFYNFGPSYAATEGYWSEAAGSYRAVHRTANLAAQVDDVLAGSVARPSRVALLYSMANEYWNAQASFADKRATFLALSHEYFQPELVTEDQIAAGALAHYDALYVLDPVVAAAAQQKIADWTRGGGLLWACADAARFNEFHEPSDLLASLAKIERTFSPDHDAPKTTTPAKPVASSLVVAPVGENKTFRRHRIVTDGMPVAVTSTNAASPVVRANYVVAEGTNQKSEISNQQSAIPTAAWLETPAGSGKVIYIAHRVGRTYSSLDVRPAGYADIWSALPRPLLTVPLMEKKVTRELTLSQPGVMSAPMTSDRGTVIVLYNVRAHEQKNVLVELRETKQPLAVQTFVNDRLADLPFEFADGVVRCTLPELAREQMVLVRQQPAPPDDRLEKMWTTAEAELQSSDPRTLSAGAWFIGMLGQPDKSLTAEESQARAARAKKSQPRLIDLLQHPHWTVRRAAAESLRRLGPQEVAAVFEKRLSSETDKHVIDELKSSLPIAKASHVEEEPDDGLLKQLDTLAVADHGRFVAAAVKQRSDKLARELWQRRASLAPGLQAYLPLIWEQTYDAQIGNSQPDWDEFFTKQR